MAECRLTSDLSVLVLMVRQSEHLLGPLGRGRHRVVAVGSRETDPELSSALSLSRRFPSMKWN